MLVLLFYLSLFKLRMFFVPKFHYKLLSIISKLVRTSLSLMFYSNCFIIHDPLIKRVVIMERENIGLYRLNHMSVSLTEMHKCLHKVVNAMLVLNSFVNTMLLQHALIKKTFIQILVCVCMLWMLLIYMIDRDMLLLENWNTLMKLGLITTMISNARYVLSYYSGWLYQSNMDFHDAS